MDLDGPQRKQLRAALLDAFPTLNALRIVVEDTLGEPLQNITMAGDMPTVAFELIGWARARGRLTELVVGAAAENPGNPRLRAVADGFALARGGAGENERIVVEGVPFVNAGQWIDRLARLRRAVCRFEPQAARVSLAGFGSAFLVAPEVIVTNAHVAAHLSKAEAAAAVVRFDYEVDADGQEQPGREVRLAGGAWLLASSPPEHLDYALLRLAVRASDLPAPGGAAREPIRLAGHDFTAGEPLVIVQHPLAAPLKLAFGTVVDAADGDGVTYSANTEPGSSGSPVMTTALETVALHHRGMDGANRGIRMTAILEHLGATGKREVLGA